MSLKNQLIPLEWQCSCGAWISCAWGAHPHIVTAPASAEALIAARLAGNENPDLGGATEITKVWRMPLMPVREAKNDIAP